MNTARIVSEVVETPMCSIERMIAFIEALSPGVVRICSCTAVYGEEEWNALECLGVQDDGEVATEIRVCRCCGTSLGRVLT